MNVSTIVIPKEVALEKLNEYPRDPLLLKQISGWIFAIMGEWDLTELEQKLLSGLLARN